jgi:hypothetical protein
MHAGHGYQHSAQPVEKPPIHDCAIRGICGGPAAAMLTLLSAEGVLTARATVQIECPPAGEPIASPHQPIVQFESPDAPPPRVNTTRRHA